MDHETEKTTFWENFKKTIIFHNLAINLAKRINLQYYILHSLFFFLFVSLKCVIVHRPCVCAYMCHVSRRVILELGNHGFDLYFFHLTVQLQQMLIF